MDIYLEVNRQQQYTESCINQRTLSDPWAKMFVELCQMQIKKKTTFNSYVGCYALHIKWYNQYKSRKNDFSINIFFQR